ncbi:MAG: hypothetical protein CW691_08540 [Candidatus Bathyarchaeum sp.]|nr:MAG: hypothetical protein CW691_08540 [Candidatus Bathyarchaeum sp.]
MKTSKISILAILVTLIVMAAPASAYITSQNIETKADRMVDIADQALNTIMDLVETVESDPDTMQAIEDAVLEEEFYGNVSLCVEAGTIVGTTEFTESGEGWTYLAVATQSLADKEYEDAIDNARDALTIFRDVLRSINDILVDSGVETDQILDTEVIQESIDRSIERIAELEALLADQELLDKLTDATDELTEAQDLLDAGENEDATEKLRDANALISEVCQELKEIAQELNPSRTECYLNNAFQYRERFRERFGQAWDEEIDVDELLQAFGYDNEEDFMTKFQEMIENAQGAEDVKDAVKSLKDIGQMIHKMDSALKQEFTQQRGNQGQDMPGNGKGYGNMGGGNSP